MGRPLVGENGRGFAGSHEDGSGTVILMRAMAMCSATVMLKLSSMNEAARTSRISGAKGGEGNKILKMQVDPTMLLITHGKFEDPAVFYQLFAVALRPILGTLNSSTAECVWGKASRPAEAGIEDLGFHMAFPADSARDCGPRAGGQSLGNREGMVSCKEGLHWSGGMLFTTALEQRTKTGAGGNRQPVWEDYFLA